MYVILTGTRRITANDTLEVGDGSGVAYFIVKASDGDEAHSFLHTTDVWVFRNASGYKFDEGGTANIILDGASASISVTASDGDQGAIAMDTNDQLDFTSATGGYTFDNPIYPTGGFAGTTAMTEMPLKSVWSADGTASVQDKVVSLHPALAFNKEGSVQGYNEAWYQVVVDPHATAVDTVLLGFRAENTNADTCKADIWVLQNHAYVDSLKAQTVTAADTWYTEQAGNAILKIALTGFSGGDIVTLRARGYSEESMETYFGICVLKGKW